MSTQQQQQPQMGMTQPQQQQQLSNHSSNGSGSVGPVIGVLAVITVLGALAIMIGRICSGRRIMGRGYDFESWVESKCGSCIDGRVDPGPTRVVLEHRFSPADSGEAAAAPPPPAENPMVEKKEESGEGV